MLDQQTIDKLHTMHMTGMACAFREQLSQNKNYQTLSFEERVGLMVDREWTDRQAKRFSRRLAAAKLREQSCLENIDHQTPRGLDKRTLQRLATCQWVREYQNILLVGPTGIGKTYVACALAEKACREGFSSYYRRTPRLLQELTATRLDGTYARTLTKLEKIDVLILDDWGMAPMTDQERRDLFEILEDRYHKRSTIVTSQLPFAEWHNNLSEPTFADAILDRLLHNAYKITLTGESMRKKLSTLEKQEDTDKGI